MHIPLKFGLLDKNGKEINSSNNTLLNLKTDEKTWVFDDISPGTIPSLFRGFSAPVIINSDLNHEELAFLMAHDTDAFNRWDAAQQLYFREIDSLVDDVQNQRELSVSPHLLEAFKKALQTPPRTGH